MGLWDNFWSVDDAMTSDIATQIDGMHVFECLPDINPATGLPMIDDHGSVDIMGNPYGCNNNDSFGGGWSGGSDW